MALLSASGIVLRYGNHLVLDRIDLDVEEGEVLAVLGPSGCGKTSLLRVLAGLERAEAGRVQFNGRRMDGVAPHRRGFGLMFQEYALFPHLNVRSNIEFGLRMQRQPGPERRARVAELLDLVGLEGYGERRVDQLSGGERQRVALARALAPNPRLLMLDEPLGALDRTLRESLMLELREILARLRLTSIYVTHDQQEAFALADRIAVMFQGRIRQTGGPEAIYRRPADAEVARFLGLGNLVAGTVGEDGVRVAGLGRFTPAAEVVLSGEVMLALGDERVRLSPAPAEEPSAANVFLATVERRTFQGRSLTYRLRVGAHRFTFAADATPEHLALEGGASVAVQVAADAIRVFPATAEDGPAGAG